MKRTALLVISMLIVASLVLTACGTPATETAAPPAATTESQVVQPTTAPTEAMPAETATEAPTAAPTETSRMGGWLDEIDYSVVSNDSAITQVKAGAIDIYGDSLSSADLPAIQQAGLNYSDQNGLLYELTFNPVGPTFPATGKLNPFSDPKVREAMNWLVDRNYINQEVYAGGSLAKFFPITTQFPDYADQADVVRELEAKYAYNPDKANEVITAEMESMGATMVDGKWNYNGEPVTLIFLIRNDSDGTRVPIGDYVANQLESIGFTVDRQYKTSSEASPLWVSGDPADGLWNIYTGAWSATIIDRDEGDQFQFYYSPESAYGFSKLWQDYTPTPEFADLMDKLAYNKFTSLQERHDAMSRALELALEDSERVWLIDGKGYSPFNTNVQVTYDLAAGVGGAQIYPYTLRFTDQEGGTMKFGQSDLFVDPWNPLAGSNWAFDAYVQRAVDTVSGVMYDPFTGLVWPLMIDHADVIAKEGLPIGKTLDWVNLTTQPEIQVPSDAWVDWDAKTQTFVTAADKYPDGTTANVESIVYYPSDLFDKVKWQDGSPLTMGDFIMYIIMQYFDPAKEDSPLYDESIAANYNAVLANFKGIRITSEDPLTIEFYSDSYQLDAEINVTTLWPGYTYGEAGWDIMGVSNLAAAAGELAYSADKADTDEIEWLSLIGGPSLDILSNYLDQASTENYIPFAPTMSQYVTADEAAARYANLKAWYAAHGHYWIGTGVYYLDKVFTTEKTATVKQYADYPYSADRWSRFGSPKIADAEIDGPGTVTIGQAASFDVTVTYNGEPYLNSDIKDVKALLYDATGTVVWTGEATAGSSDGQYTVDLPADVTSTLQAGPGKVEVAVVPLIVAVPTFASYEFVVSP